MREDATWFAKWGEDLPPPEELTPLSQTLITPDLAIAFDIRKPPSNPPPTPMTSPAAASNPNSSEFGNSSGPGGEEPARTLKRPRLVWTPQLHKRFVDAVAHLGIKNAVPKTIMQLMSVDGLTRENVASHLQKYRLYLKRVQGLSNGSNSSGSGGGGGDPASERLFSSSPVPPHFLSYVPAAAMQHQHQMAAAVNPQYHMAVANFGSIPNGQFEHPLQRIGANSVQNHVKDLELGSGNGGRKVLTLFPTGDN